MQAGVDPFPNALPVPPLFGVMIKMGRVESGGVRERDGVSCLHCFQLSLFHIWGEAV